MLELPGINWMQWEIFDVILIDIRMPWNERGGILRIHFRKEADTENRIIIITGDVMGLDIKAFLAQNNLPSLSKPFDIKLLKKQLPMLLMPVMLKTKHLWQHGLNQVSG